MAGTPNLDQILGLARGYARVDSRTGRTEEVSGYQGRSFLGMGTARRAFESANSAISRDEMLSGRHHADLAAVHLKANHTAPDWLTAHSNVMRAAQAISDHPFMGAHEGVRTHLAGLRQAVRDKDAAGFRRHNSALERHVARFRSVAGVTLAAGDDEYDEPDDDDLPGDPEDWDEDDWGDVRAHLAKESPWFSQVMAGEDPGDPDSAPQGWQDRAREILTVGMTDRTAEASTTHEPTVGPGGPGLFHIKGRQLPPYVQHLYKHLVAKYGKHRAYGVAIGIVKKWAAGVNPGGKGKGHKVHADVQAAAGKNIAEWEKDKADAHSHGETRTTNTIGLAAVRGYDRVEHGRVEHVEPHERWLGSLRYQVHHDPEEGLHGIEAYLPGSRLPVGSISWYHHPDDEVSWPDQIDVHPDHQHKGLATELWRRARQINPTLQHSDNQTEAGHAWAAHAGLSVPNLEVIELAHGYDRVSHGRSEHVRAYYGHRLMEHLRSVHGVQEDIGDSPEWHKEIHVQDHEDMIATGHPSHHHAPDEDRAWMPIARVRPASLGHLQSGTRIADRHLHPLTATPNLDQVISLAAVEVKGYERAVNGREELVRPHQEQRFLHGTAHVLAPGTVLTAAEAARLREAGGGAAGTGPESKKMYAVHSLGAASMYAHRAAVDKYEGDLHWGGNRAPDKSARPHVYEVEPVGHATREQTGHSAAAWRVKGEVPGDYSRHPHAPWAGEEHRMTSPLDQVLSLGGAPAAWPSGRPYQESFLPKPGGGPGSGKTELKQGYPTNTGVITTSPGAQPIVYGHLRQAPSQTVSAGPPLPPGVKLPDPKDFEALASKISDGPDRQLAESARSHLQAAADKFRTGDRQGPLTMLRIVQTDLHSLYRKVVAANRPHEAQVFSERGFAGSVPPAAQSSARAEMFASREQMLEYRTQVTQVAKWIDVFRRSYFHGQYQGVAEGRFSVALDQVVALARGYERVEHGRLEQVSGYGVSTPEEFHARYLPKFRVRLDYLKAEADRISRLALDPGSPGWAKAEKAALDAHAKYNAAVKAAVAKTVASSKLGLVALAHEAVRGYERTVAGKVEHVRPSFRDTLAFDYDGVLHSERGYHWPAADLDFSGIDKAHARGYNAAVVTANEPRFVARELESRGYKTQLDPDMRTLFWDGGSTGKRILVTSRKVSAKAYIDDRAVNHRWGDDWDNTLDDVERVRDGMGPLGQNHDKVAFSGAAQGVVLVQLTVNQPAGPKKDQASVHYRDGSGNKDCGGCSMVRIMPPDFETLTCTAVKGPIREDGVCDIWAPSPEDGALHKLTSAQVENALVALAKSYERVEHGRVEQVSGYNSRAKLDAAIKSGLFSVSRGPAVPAKPEPKAPDRGLARAGSELPLERKPSRFACIDCKRETTSTKPGALTENYSVHNRVWAAAGNPNGHLCIGCMEKRLGRKLTGADFPDMPVNNLANSDNPRLAWSYRTARLKELLKDHPSSERTKLHLTSAQIENALLALTTVDPYKRVVAGKMQIVRSYDRKQGRFVDVLGHRHWGWYGGAGILPVHTDEHDTIRYGLQKRAGGVQHSGSFSTAGGAIDKLPSGEIETPVQAALREAEEEFGKIPEGEVSKVYTDQHGIAGEPGSWAYHTVHVKYPEMFKPDAKASHGFESGGIKWVTAEEMGKLPLHPDFRAYAEAHLGVQTDPAKQPKDYTIAQEAAPDEDFRKGDEIEYHHKGNGLDKNVKATVKLEPDKKHPTYLVQPALWKKNGDPVPQIELKRQHILTTPPGHPPKKASEPTFGPVDMPTPREPGEIRTGDEVKWTGEDGKERSGRVTYVHSEGSVDVAPPPPPKPPFGKGKFKEGERVAHRDKEGNIKAGVITGMEDTTDKWGAFTAYHVKYDDGSEGDHAADRLVNEKYAKSLKAGGGGGSSTQTGGGSYGLGYQTGFKPGGAYAPTPGTLAPGDKVTFYDPNEDLDRSGTVTEADSEGRIIITSDDGDRYSVSPVEYHDVRLQRVIPPKAKAPKGSMSPVTGGKAKPKFAEGDIVKRRSFTANQWDAGKIIAANVAVSALGYPVHQVEFDHGTANVPESMLKKV